MATQTKIQRVGQERGLKVRHDVLARQHLSVGDGVHIIETKDGLLITPFSPDFEHALTRYDEGSSDYRDALRKVARSRGMLPRSCPAYGIRRERGLR